MSPYLKSVSRVIPFVLAYIMLPVYLAVHPKAISIKTLFLYLVFNLVLALLCLKNNRDRIHGVRIKIGDLRERINIQCDMVFRESQNKIAYEQKKQRYGGLRQIIESLNKSLELDDVAQELVDQAFLRIADNKGACLLYLADTGKGLSLSLFKSRKQDRGLVVKAKEGDIFDLWVLRHTTPLLVEDIKKDFRFDLNKLRGDAKRGFSSLISAPLAIEHKFLGLLRLDAYGDRAYSQDDLRFLMTICDLGAVALENAQLFKKTQELAIHDELTALFTKGYFLDRLGEEARRNLRREKEYSLIMLDIDFFKKYNDTYGHTAGDIVLKTIARTLTEFFKDYSPTISRFGGEEFCVALPEISRENACSLSGVLLRKIEEKAIVLRKQETHITVSIGVAGSGGPATNATEMIIKADRAMYAAKQQGRNRVVCG